MAARNRAGGARPDNKGQVKKELKRVGDKLDILEQRVDRLEAIAEQQDFYRRLRVEHCALLESIWLRFEQSRSRAMSYGSVRLQQLKKQSGHSSRDRWMKRQRSAKHKSSPRAKEHSPRLRHARLWQKGSKSKSWLSGSGRTDQGLLTWFWQLASLAASSMIWCAKNAIVWGVVV